MLEPARGASGDGADDVQVGEQRLGHEGIWSHGRVRGVVGDVQHEHPTAAVRGVAGAPTAAARPGPPRPSAGGVGRDARCISRDYDDATRLVSGRAA